MSRRTVAAFLAAFGLGALAGRGTGPSAKAQDKAAADPYAEMLHVDVVVKDLDQAVARRYWIQVVRGDGPSLDPVMSWNCSAARAASPGAIR